MTRPIILDRIFKLAIPSKPSVPSPQTNNARAHKTRQRDRAPYPGAARIFDRPFQHLSGPRHIPVLVNANKFPFLRIKKPQPPTLSRMIRQTTQTREHRLSRGNRLANECLIAQDEDEWDQLHYEDFGLDYGQADEQPWEYEVKRALDTNHQQQVDAIRKRTNIAAKMYAIVEQEKALAKKEKDGKKQARWARWLARRRLSEIDLQETLHPQPEETIREVEVFPSPGETFKKPVSDQSHEEVHQPDMGQVSRKRSANFKTRDEIRQLLEATLRPRTDEEVAKIKEARIKRREEKRELKAQKSKRRQEDAAVHEQALRRKGEERIWKAQKPWSEQGNIWELRLKIDEEERARKAEYRRQERGEFWEQTLHRDGKGSTNNQQGSYISRLQEELQKASDPVSDTRLGADQTEDQAHGVFRPSLLREEPKNPQQNNQS